MHSYLGSIGIRLDGVCPICDGDGELATTERAAYYPYKYPDEIEPCDNCNGLGGNTKEAGERGRRISSMYAEALGVPISSEASNTKP